MPAVIERPKNKQDSKKSDRMEFRVSAVSKQAIQDAADLKGMTAASFVAAAAYEAAQATLLGSELMKLNRVQSSRLAESLINPPEPNVALRNLMKDRKAAK